MNTASAGNGVIKGAGEVIKKSILEEVVDGSPEVKEDVINLEEEVEKVSTPIVEEDNVIEKQTELPISEKEPFNPNLSQDARVSDDNEGGIVPNTTTGATGMSGTSQARIDEEKRNNDMFELGGFKIQYKLPNSKDVIGEDVRDFYDTIEEARNSIVEDGIYNKKLKDGSIVRSSITMGAPIICFGDVQKLEYISGTWRR